MLPAPVLLQYLSFTRRAVAIFLITPSLSLSCCFQPMPVVPLPSLVPSFLLLQLVSLLKDPLPCVFTDSWQLSSSKVMPGGSVGKESACNVGDLGSIPGLGRSPGEGNSYPLQYSSLENSMDRKAWQATVHGVAKSWTWLSNFHSLKGMPKFPFPPTAYYISVRANNISLEFLEYDIHEVSQEYAKQLESCICPHPNWFVR